MKKHITPTTKKTMPLKGLRNLDPARAGIDIGANSVFVCIANAQGQQEVREYTTFTVDLREMANWLKGHGIKSVAMESTGVYWIPVFEILDPMGFEVVLANAHHLKNVPGRKTDVKDCQWIQQLHSNGLLSASFRPSDDFVRLRSFVRQRRQLFEQAAGHIQHMHKALVQMNVQTQLVLSHLTCKTGLGIIQAIIAGERDPLKLASHRQKTCKKSTNEIAKALEGTWREEHLFALRQAYEAYEFYHRQIQECEEVIHALLLAISPSKEPINAPPPSSKTPPTLKKRLKKTTYNRSPYHFDAAAAIQPITCHGIDITEIPGIDANILLTVLSEIGSDMSKWKSVKQFCSWLGLCPGSKISGGKILSSKTKRSNNRAAHALRLAANTLHRSKTSLGAYFRRMRAHLGAPKAITATAHKLARILYRMLKYGKTYEELGADYYEQRYKERTVKNLIKKAKEMGYELVPST